MPPMKKPKFVADQVKMRVARARFGVTLQVLADLVGVSVSTMQRIESGQVRVCSERAEIIARDLLQHRGSLFKRDTRPASAQDSR